VYLSIACRHAVGSHHGNGSEDIFAGDKRVLMVSTFERGYIPTTARCRLGPI